jgi:hypothetical protein
VSVDADGAGQVVSGEAVDNLGNRTIGNAAVNLDQEDPRIEALLSAEPNEKGGVQLGCSGVVGVLR